MFVTPKVFKLIGPSNDGQRHGRDTYLFDEKLTFSFMLSVKARLRLNILSYAAVAFVSLTSLLLLSQVYLGGQTVSSRLMISFVSKAPLR
jgi:hypothetical protein